ncbi:MAG: hypothetical protein CGW95_14145 [Phenylobacterium zucineum]|nr:MAG: hypothetical protein CGW95_14145 [Phenylobacterium zucineum]
MLYRPLGATGLRVSEIGYGCASWWGQKAFPEDEALRLVHYAIDQGVTLFDTSPAYSGGNAEPRLGRALKGLDTSKLIVATKAGTRFVGGRVRRDMSLAAIEQDILKSLVTLGLETLPVLQLHGPDPSELTPEFEDGLLALKRRGLFQALGANSFDPVVLDLIIASPAFDLVMMDVNVLRPERKTQLKAAKAAGKGVLAGMPLAMGHTNLQILKIRGVRDLWYAARALKNHRHDISAGARFRFLNQVEGISGAQAALSYVLSHSEISCAVVGATRQTHLAEDLAASGLTLPPDLARRIIETQMRR